MKLQYFSHRHADKLLAACGLLQELDTALSALPVPIYPGKSEAKQRSEKQVIVQTVLNTLIELQLVDLGWLAQPQVMATAGAGKTRYYADFYKADHAESLEPYVGRKGSQIQALVEVQFANTARADSDLKKFSIGFSQGRCDVGILVVPLKCMANRMSSNVANFEYVVDGLLELGQLMAPVPLLVIGLSEEDAPLVDLSQSQFTSVKQLTGESSKHNRIIAANAILRGVPVEFIGPDSALPAGFDFNFLQAGDEDAEHDQLDREVVGPAAPPTEQLAFPGPDDLDDHRGRDCGGDELLSGHLSG